MNEYIWETAEELDKKIADRVRLIRKRRSISQEKLAQISGVSFGSVKRFETTGHLTSLIDQDCHGTGYGRRFETAFYRGSLSEHSGGYQ